MTTTYLEAKYINSRSQNRNEEQAHEHIRKKDGDLAKLKQIDFSSIHLFKFVIIKEIKKVLKLLLWLLVVVVVCHDQVRLQVSQGFRCRDS